MNTSQLKIALHETIENINDAELLKTLADISRHHYNTVEEPELNKYQVNRLHESREQIKDGKFFTDAQANELISKWLNK